MINDIGFNKIRVSNKCPFGKKEFKYFINFKDSEKVRPLFKFWTQMIIYERNLIIIDAFNF